MMSFAVISASCDSRQPSTCFRMPSKFRCIRSTPIDSAEVSEKFFECLASTGWKSPEKAMFLQTNDAHPERIARIVFLNPMPPANRPYNQQRNEKTASLITTKDAKRLKEIQKEWGTANDDQIRALCVDQFRILAGPYFSNPLTYDPSRPEAGVAGREIAGMCGAPALLSG